MSKASAFLGGLERLALFSLSLAVGLLNLLIALVVATHLNVIPREHVDRLRGYARSKFAFFKPADAPAPKHSAPAKNRRR
jgi:hypothetical protein